MYQKSVFAGIRISLEFLAILFEWNHVLPKGLISLLNGVFYLDRLLNFSSGKSENKNQHRGPAKEKTTERDRLTKTSTSALQSSCPQRPLGPTLVAAFAQPETHEMEGEPSTRHPRPCSELTLRSLTCLSSLLHFPSSPSLPFAKGRCSTDESPGQVSTGTYTCFCFTHLQDLPWGERESFGPSKLLSLPSSDSQTCKETTRAVQFFVWRWTWYHVILSVQKADMWANGSDSEGGTGRRWAPHPIPPPVGWALRGKQLYIPNAPIAFCFAKREPGHPPSLRMLLLDDVFNHRSPTLRLAQALWEVVGPEGSVQEAHLDRGSGFPGCSQGWAEGHALDQPSPKMGCHKPAHAPGRVTPASQHRLLPPGLLPARRCPFATALCRELKNIWDWNEENVEVPRISSAWRINSLHGYTP